VEFAAKLFVFGPRGSRQKSTQARLFGSLLAEAKNPETYLMGRGIRGKAFCIWPSRQSPKIHTSAVIWLVARGNKIGNNFWLGFENKKENLRL
jgi:hypothetical protein